MSRTVSPSNNEEISTTSFDDLPEETTVEILLKLGVKDLIRSTSVNKTWYSLINNPFFISSQIRNAVSCCRDNAVLSVPPITSLQNYCSLISADTSSLIQKFDIPFVTRTRSLRLLAQVHGLLLLTDLHMGYSCRELYLWNPYVKKHRLLVSSCFKKLLNDRKGSFYFAGMGFDKVLNDYKIIRIIYVEDEKRKLFGKVAPKVEIFSLRKNMWRKLENPGVPTLVNEIGIYVDGCFYWLELKQPGTEEAQTCCGNKLAIMSFDFHTELFGEFKVPHDVPNILGRIAPFKLMQFEDSLALCVLGEPLRGKGYPYYIWSMRQENGVVIWTFRFRAILKESGYPLDITKNGTLIVEALKSYSLEVTRIISYNIKGMIRKDLGFGKHGGPDVPPAVRAPSTVDTLFPESLIMYEGGKHGSLSSLTPLSFLLKFIKLFRVVGMMLCLLSLLLPLYKITAP